MLNEYQVKLIKDLIDNSIKTLEKYDDSYSQGMISAFNHTLRWIEERETK